MAAFPPPTPNGVPSGALILDGRCFRRQDAVAAGLSQRQVTTLLADGALRQVLRGVYVDARRDDELAVRVAALDLVRPPDVVICRRTAAWLRGVDAHGIAPTAPLGVDCVVPRGRTPLRRAGLRCYSAYLAGDVEVVSGVPCTTAVRTGLDLLRFLPPHLGLGAVDALARAGVLSRTALVDRAETAKGGRNIVRARRLASYTDPLSESFGESWTRLRILDAGFPCPRAQVPVGHLGRAEYRLDLGYPERRIAVEYDGLEFHSSAADRGHDARRRDRLRDEFGWTVLVVGHGEVLGRSLAFERALGELLGLEPQISRRTW